MTLVSRHLWDGVRFKKVSALNLSRVTTIKTEDPRQTGTESRVTGRETQACVAPETGRWVPPTLIKEYEFSEEAKKDAVFRKVRELFFPNNFFLCF